jgi:triacylglycerol esterase/lipase EstA (alpha/beta hydrolase family)
MLARLLRALLAVLAVLGAGAAWWAGQRLGWSAAGQAAMFVAVLAGPTMAIALLASLLAFVYRTPPPPGFRRGPIAAAGGLLVEVFWFAVVYLVLQPFPRLWLPAESGQRTGERAPVLLIPGFMCNAGLWAGFARALRRRGHAVFTHTPEPVFGPIDAYAGALAERVAALSAAAGGRRVALVGHSMGGLIARAYLRRYGGDRIACLVTLGSPHHGSALAPFGYGENAREMRRTAAWLGGLAAFDEGRLPVPTTSLFSYHDNFVAPQISSELAGATNVPLAGMGHMTLVFSPRVVARVDEALAAAQR